MSAPAIDLADQCIGAAIADRLAGPPYAFLIEESVHLLIEYMLILLIPALLLSEVFHSPQAFDAVLESAELLEGVDAILADDVGLEL